MSERRSPTTLVVLRAVSWGERVFLEKICGGAAPWPDLGRVVWPRPPPVPDAPAVVPGARTPPFPRPENDLPLFPRERPISDDGEAPNNSRTTAGGRSPTGVCRCPPLPNGRWAAQGLGGGYGTPTPPGGVHGPTACVCSGCGQCADNRCRRWPAHRPPAPERRGVGGRQWPAHRPPAPERRGVGGRQWPAHRPPAPGRRGGGGGNGRPTDLRHRGGAGGRGHTKSKATGAAAPLVLAASALGGCSGPRRAYRGEFIARGAAERCVGTRTCKGRRRGAEDGPAITR